MGKRKRKRWSCAVLTAVLLMCSLGLTSCSASVSTNGQDGFGTAHWIWADAEESENIWADFRRDFTLEEVPDEALIRIAVDGKYWLYVNDTRVTAEGGLTRGPNEEDTYYDELDIAEYLVEGTNSISVLVWYWGTTDGATHYITAGTAGLLVSTDLTEGKKTIETGDGSWYARVDPAYSQGGDHMNIYLGEYNVSYDAGREADWTAAEYDPSAEGWAKAVVVGEDEDDPGYAGDAPWGALVLRPTPMIMDYGLTILNMEEAKLTEDEDGNTVYRFTLPYNMQISPYIELGEGTEEGLTVTAYTETYEMSTLCMTYTTAGGSGAYEHLPWINGDYLYFTVPEGVEVVSFGYRQTGYEVERSEDGSFAGSFDSVIAQDDVTAGLFTGGHTWDASETSEDNNFYDELWTKSVYTLYVCMRDGWMDCPDRERGQYIGDILNESEEAYYVLGTSANALTAKAIREICEGQYTYKKKGVTYYAMSAVEPIEDVHEIPIQELGAAVVAWKYYLYTGDETVAQDCWQALYNYLTNYGLETEGEYAGTIRMRDEEELKETYNIRTSHLTQWSDWGDNQDVRVAINCWWYMSAEAVLNLAAVDGVEATQEQIDWIEEMMKQVEENFELFWNEELAAYATEFSEEDWYKAVESEDGTHLVDDRVNALAVVSGLADESHYEAIRNVFMGTEDTPAYQNASIYMERYVLQALYEMGYSEDAMERMQERYMTIVNDSTSSTLPELWQETSAYVDSDGTKNHGWSGGGLIALSHYASGIEPVTAGYETWRVCPQMGNFSSFTVTVPAQIGDIEETITRSDEDLTMTVTSPGGTAEIWVPLEEGQSAAVIQGDAEYLGEQTAYGSTYAVYQITEAGTYSFLAS